MKILINGYTGRMGQAIKQQAEKLGYTIIEGTKEASALAKAMADCDIAIDVSSHEATALFVATAAKLNKPVVIGTTGHTEAEEQEIRTYENQIPMVWSGNFSIGVNLLFYLTEQVAAVLSEDYHPEIVEMHHLRKKDAPSGTARHLIEAILKGRNWSKDDVRYGRNGITGSRPDQEIGVHALRGGEVVGEHTVIFAGPGERLELKHQAADRTIFAQGAMRAAEWVREQKPGIYSMREVLGV
ncbi:MAG: 4-hydroxy-tetrahydrodipicolinate reductase [Bacteroidota bacterium]